MGVEQFNNNCDFLIASCPRGKNTAEEKVSVERDEEEDTEEMVMGK